MIRRSLAVSLVLALSSAPVFAEDLMQTYELARQGDPASLARVTEWLFAAVTHGDLDYRLPAPHAPSRP